MADSYTDKARRDAELALIDEFDSIATLVEQARSSAEAQKRSIEQARQSGIAGVYQNARREDYDLMSQMTGSNMGAQSGMRIQGLRDTARTRQQAVGEIEGSAATALMNIAEQLNMVLNEASRSRSSLARKKTLLIGQLADKYRQEAEAVQMQKDQIAAEAAYRNQMLTLERDKLTAETEAQETMDERQFRAHLGELSATLEAGLADGSLTTQDAWRQVRNLALSWERPVDEETLLSRYAALMPRALTHFPAQPQSASSPTILPQRGATIGARARQDVGNFFENVGDTWLWSLPSSQLAMILGQVLGSRSWSDVAKAGNVPYQLLRDIWESPEYAE